jgi:membrane protein
MSGSVGRCRIPWRAAPESPFFEGVRPRDTYERARQFFETRIWSVRLDNMPWWRRQLYRFGRATYATVRGFFDKELTSRAASLTYYTMLSIVPFLAFAFSLLKGLGVYHRLMRDSVRPYLHQAFKGDESLLQGLDQMLAFVERTSVSGLSVVGVIFLAYTAISMLSTVESALNGIWDVRSSRPIIRKVTDYTTILVIGPLLIIAAITISAAAQNSTFVAYLHRSLLLGNLVDFCLHLTSVVLGCAGLVALYVILPNTRVRFTSALFGGVVAGLLWQGALMLHVRFQIGVANYNALYATFAALPIFLVWLYLSWNIVLIGAGLAASHQYEQRMRQAMRARHVDQELKEHLAVVVAAAVSRSFIDGHPAPTAAVLAEALEVPPPAVEEVLDALVGAGLLVRVAQGDEPRYDPARDVDAVRMVDLEDAVRHDPSPEADAVRSALDRAAGPALSTLLRARRDEAFTESGRLTLRELARQCPREIDGVTAASQTPKDAPEDGKKPDA